MWENPSMVIQFQVPHKIGAEEARKWLYAQAADRGVSVEADPTRPEDPNAGEVEHGTPVGSVRVRFAISPTRIDVEVVKKPTFAPAGVLQSEMEKRLGELLA